MKIKLIGASLVAGLSTLISGLSTLAYADTPAYINVLVGAAEQTERFEDIPDISGYGTSRGIRVGYRFIDNLAGEIAYQDFGAASEAYTGFGVPSQEKIETTAITLGLKGIWPVSENFNLNARFGIAEWDYDYRSEFPSSTDSGSDSGSDIYYGLGFSYQLTKVFGLGVEYTIMDHEVNLNGFRFDRDLRNTSVIFNFEL